MVFLLDHLFLSSSMSTRQLVECGTEVLSSFMFRVRWRYIKTKEFQFRCSHMFFCNSLMTQIKSQVATIHVSLYL